MISSRQRGPSLVQKGFQNSIRQRFLKGVDNRTVWYHPPEVRLDLKPSVENFYLKKVMICAPIKQCPTVTFLCPQLLDESNNLLCGGILKRKGWNDTDGRYVYEAGGGFYMHEMKYVCEKCNKFISGIKLANSTSIPKFVQLSYPVHAFHKSAITFDLMSTILSDATTAKTFEEASTGYEAQKATKYLQARSLYESWKQFHTNQNEGMSLFSSSSSSSSSELPEFSAMDSEIGYNEGYVLSSERIIEIFTGTSSKKCVFTYCSCLDM